MTFVSDDRWTCPTCQETVAFPGHLDRHRAELTRVQISHGLAHPAAKPKPRRRGLIIQFPTHAETEAAERRRRAS